MVGSRYEREVEWASAVAVARPYDPAQGLANRSTVADKKNRAELLASHGARLLSTIAHMLESDPPTLHADAAFRHLLTVIDAARDERTGLSFVPAVVRRLNRAMAVSAAHDLLLAAARREVIELRPEGGLGRLNAEELALCPPGPAGTRLSWARRASGVEA